MILRRILKSKPDLIYERYALFNFAGVLAARLCRIPIVLEVNSPLALENQREQETRHAHADEADEREETGVRAVLNYGHTFCHALETVTGYGQFLHGEAVSIGMLCASRLAESLGRVDSELTRRQHDLLVELGLPVEVPEADRDELAAAMQHDKKVEHGRLRFVLPTKMGHVELVGDVDPQRAKAAFG